MRLPVYVNTTYVQRTGEQGKGVLDILSHSPSSFAPSQSTLDTCAMTASPFRSLFKSSSSSPDHEAARPQPKLRLTKPRPASAPGAAQNIDATATKRSILFNLILPPDPATSHAQSSMLLPPAALFPSLAGSGAKSPRLRDAFTKTKKKQPTPDTKLSCISTGTSIPTEPARPWGAWIPGAATSSTSLPMAGLDASGQAKPSQARLWARRSEEKEAAKEEKRKAKLQKSAVAAAATANGQNGPDPSSAGRQIMLHPSYNLSNQSVAESSHPGSPHQHECFYSCQQQQQQRHLQHSRPRVFGVTLAVHDIFGIGKVTEMSLALFLAHDAFLSRRPFWLQCAVLAWEGIVVLLVLWGVLRVVGLAEVVVWGADDLIRGVVSIFRTLSLALKMMILSW
ncbi:unnamed protein product [Mortierella alpina]